MDEIDILFKNHSFNSRLLLKEMRKRKINLVPIPKTKIVKAIHKKHIEVLYDIYTNLIPYTKGILVDDKYYSKKYLSTFGIKVNRGEIFDAKSIRKALSYAEEIGFPVVLKPTISSHGESVIMDVQNEKELEEAIDIFLKKYSRKAYFLIEEQYDAQEFRLFITRNNFFAAVKRIPANITGDGKHPIKRLIEDENYRRMNPRNTCLCKIPIDHVLHKYIKKQNLSLNSVLSKGEKIFLRKNSNVSTGGNCYDMTEEVSQYHIRLAKRVLKVLGVPLLGIDLLCKDITKKNEYRVCELNSAPGLSLHMMPERGKPRDAASALVDIIFPES